MANNTVRLTMKQKPTRDETAPSPSPPKLSDDERPLAQSTKGSATSKKRFQTGDDAKVVRRLQLREARKPTRR
jgi:hypothetical protein